MSETERPPHFILTLSCPDTTGVVAAAAGFLAAHQGLITEAHHFDDPYTDTSFMRVVFRDNGKGLPALPALHALFEQEVAGRFNMIWQFRAIQKRCRVLLAVSHHQELRSLGEWHGLPFHYLPLLAGDKRGQEQRIIGHFEAASAELLVLARYMQILSPEACDYFAGKAINIHHSFLPGFKGARAYYQAHERGVKLIGATAHYVTNDLDEGPIIEQEVERVDHTLSPEQFTDIGRDLESVVLARAVRWHAEWRIFRNGNKTVILR